MIKRIINRITCKHTRWIKIDTFYGDKINFMGGRRLIECKNCGKRKVVW